MFQRPNLWHFSLVPVISGFALFTLESKDLTLALNGMGGISSFALIATEVIEIGFVWLVLKSARRWNRVPAIKKNIFHVLVLLIFLGLVFSKTVTGSFVEEALRALFVSFAGIYFMVIGLLKYRMYLAWRKFPVEPSR
jgi:polyferredoxin